MSLCTKIYDKKEQDNICHEVQTMMHVVVKKIAFYIGNVRNIKLVKAMRTMWPIFYIQWHSNRFYPHEPFPN